MGEASEVERFIAEWRDTGGSELANTQSFLGGLCRLIGVQPPRGSRTDDAQNDYVFERRVFQDNGDGTVSFGRIDCYKRSAFILEAKQGSEADRAAAERGEDDLDLFGQTATARLKRGTARRGTPGCGTGNFLYVAMARMADLALLREAQMRRFSRFSLLRGIPRVDDRQVLSGIFFDKEGPWWRDAPSGVRASSRPYAVADAS